MIRVVVGAIVTRGEGDEKEILMVQEGQERNRGRWNFPMGGLDDGEYIFEGARREVREETGYEIELTGLNSIFSTNNGRPQFVFFDARAVKGEGNKWSDDEEIMDMKWIPIDEVLKLDLRKPGGYAETILARVKGGVSFPLETVEEIR